MEIHCPPSNFSLFSLWKNISVGRGVEERESCDVCPLKRERLPKLGQQEEKKKVIIADLKREKNFLENGFFLLWTYLCYKNGQTPGGQRPSLVPGVLEECISWFSGAQYVNWFK